MKQSTIFRLPNTMGTLLCAVFATSICSRTMAQHGSGHTFTPTAITCPAIAVTNLIPFLDPLPIPGKMVPSRTNSNFCLPVAPVIAPLCLPVPPLPEYDVRMTSFLHFFHTNLPPVEVWGYNGSYPGLTFDVLTNAPILVNWINDLPSNYPSWLPANTLLHGVSNQTVRTVVHLHGGATLPRYDGYPTNTILSGERHTYYYGNIDFNDDGETLWYHDHALSLTANNVYAGLAGFYLIRNPAIDANLNLPSSPFEIPLVFQDRDIQTNCQPASLMLGQFPWHSLVVVNGKVNPYLEVQPRKYRFRILNGAGYRTFGPALSITDTNGVILPGATNPPVFYVIGNEDGYLPQVVITPPLTNNPNIPSGSAFNLMPGERIDLIIDFTSYTNQANRIITMGNFVNNANPTNIVRNPPQQNITNIMQFRVSLPLSPPDTSSIPTNILGTNWVSTATMVSNVIVNRQITLDLQSESPFPGKPFVTNGAGPFALLDLKAFEEPIDVYPSPGDTEIWSIINLTSEGHPIHVHLLDFRVVGRTRFAGWANFPNTAFPPTMVTNYIQDRIAGTLKPLTNYLGITNFPINFAPFEGGPKDVVRAAPFSVTQIVMQWPTNVLFYSTPSAWNLDPATAGRYIYHCHILDHEDNDMMRPLQLLQPGNFHIQTVFDFTLNSTGNNRFKFRIDSRRGDRYRIETSTNVAPGNWIPLPSGDVAGTGDAIYIIPPPSTEPSRFYRGRKVLP